MGIKRFPAVTGSLFFYPRFAIYMNSSIPKPSIFVAKKNMEDISILLDILNAVLKIIKSTTDLIRTLKKKKE